MTTSILGFNEHVADASRWATRTASVSFTAGGTTTAGMPITNIFTPNPSQVWQATGISNPFPGPNPVTIDVQLNNATNPVAIFNNVAGVWGLLNLSGTLESTGTLIDLQVRIQESGTAFTGPYEYDRTQTLYLQQFQSAAARQLWFYRRSSMTAGSAFERDGGSGVPVFTRITITPINAGSNWTLRLGRLVRMTTLLCRIDPQPTRTTFDQSEIVRSFSGYPYVLQASRGRRYRGRMIGLTDRQVNGVFFSEDSTRAFTPSINTIAQLAGRSREVCVIEQANLAASSSRWQQQPVFGLLDGDLVASRESSTSDGEGLSSVDFDVVEIPQFVS